MTEQNPVIRRYLEQFEAGLRGFPAGEREEIVREIQSHIAEAVNSGSSVADVLVRLGAADRLARAYTAEAILSGPGRPLRKSLAAAVVLAASGIASLVLIPFLSFIGLVFTLAGASGAVGNAVYLISGHKIPWLGDTKIFGGPTPGLDQWLGIGLGIAFFLAGLGVFSLVKRYMQSLIKNIRQAVAARA